MQRSSMAMPLSFYPITTPEDDLAQGKLPVKFASVGLTTTAATTIVTAVSGKKIRVVAVHLTVSASTADVTVSSDANSLFVLYADSGVPLVSLAFPWGLFETNSGEALKMTSAAVANVGGFVAYVEV